MAPALRLIDRSDLLAALDTAVARKVTIISAPAGSGKTSLLHAWADRPSQPRRLAVVQVQRDQQDLQDFCLALLAGVRRVRGVLSDAETPTATPDFNARAMASRVLSELADAGSDVMLIIEDLHELKSAEALGQLSRALLNLPDGVHALLTTRHDLPLRLHQLRLAGELSEIRAADLRFCCGWSCVEGCQKKYPRCTGGQRHGSASMARLSRPSGTRRRRATGLMRPGCSRTIRSA